jgi:hypothetical protein
MKVGQDWHWQIAQERRATRLTSENAVLVLQGHEIEVIGSLLEIEVAI